MVSYATFFALAAIATRDFARERGLRLLAAAGIVTPIFATAAALFDAAENIAWLLVLGGHGGSLAPPFATTCASLKFLLIGLAILYVVWGLVVRLLRRWRPSQSMSGADHERLLNGIENSVKVRKASGDDVPRSRAGVGATAQGAKRRPLTIENDSHQQPAN
jgi:hypothetical protein